MSSRFLLIPLKDDNEAGPPKPHEGRTWIIVMDLFHIDVFRDPQGHKLMLTVGADLYLS